MHVAVAEDEARAYAKESNLPIVGCCCPVCGDLGLQRQRMKRLLVELEREHPGVRQSMIRALTNVQPRHLLDRRLHDPTVSHPSKPPAAGAALGPVTKAR